ncbi:VOC family protein [Candidatus Woesebacteria bacterium]|nr:VOC family protein [Candidatus Woesebacteria bacterium]
MLQSVSLMIGSNKPQELAAFYEKVLGKPADYADKGWFGFQIGAIFLSIGEHSEVKETAQEPQRMMLNFETPDVEKEFERIKTLGATVIKEPYSMEGGMIATFADVDGNYFQLMPPWKSM